jgi:hypothetical protein
VSYQAWCKLLSEVLRKRSCTKVTTLPRRQDRQLTELGSNADGISRRMRFVVSDDEFEVWVCMWE